MTLPLSQPSDPAVDLTEAPPLLAPSRALERLSVGRTALQTLETLTEHDDPGERSRRLGQFLRKLDADDTVEILKAAGQSSLAHERSGVRFLFGFLEVKRPGVEVLRQLELLSSLERVALRVVSGRWAASPNSSDPDPVLPILEVLEEGARVGVLDVGIDSLPRRPQALLTLLHHVRTWFSDTRIRLELGHRLPEAILHYLTQLGMVEIHLLESRLSRLAVSIDPHDARGIARLLPVLSRYDQDVAHMKTVVSQLVTYQPFYERLLTTEQTTSPEAMDRIVKRLGEVEATGGIRRLLVAVRENPVLDRRLVYLTAVSHQVGRLRAQKINGTPVPDLHSSILRVLETDQGETPLRLRLEPAVADDLWIILEGWGLVRTSSGVLEAPFREDRALRFIDPDGTPKLAEGSEERGARQLSLKELLRSQLRNDGFVLGILENPKATAMPGVVELIAAQSRSLRVLDKIARMSSLFTGPANKNVPALLLTNPSRIPLTEIRRFINVRYVSRVELRHMIRNAGGIRSEVRKEIEAYLVTLKG